MPSKTKKPSRASSRLSNHDYSASPQTSSLTSSADSDINEQDQLFYLEEASSRFPCLIGKSALIGSVINANSKSSRCTIWLSESSMVACSLPPGSVVSVSLAASGSGSANTFPLTSFLGEMAKHFEIELMDEIASEFGNYFALATVFPSREVAKNGVLLSSSLAYTMGCPASGSVVFVYPVRSQPLTALLNGNNGPQNSKTDNFSIHICNELFLELVPTAGIVKNNGDLRSTKNSLEEINGQSENCSSFSRKTPLCRPKISSSPSHQASARHEAASSLSYPDNTSVDSFEMKEALRNESTKQLLQGCATSELYSRALVRGNLVTIQLLSKLFFFRVVGINKLVASIDQDLMEEKIHSSAVDHFKGAFLVNHETKVHLCVPISSAAETPRNRGFTFAGGENMHADTNIEYDVSKLGGLGEEYATLKDIISSSMKNTLLRFGLRTTKGVLLHGPPGTGKTTLARLCVRDAGVNLFLVNGPEIFSQYHGESEQAMQKVFHLASQAAPAVVFIDELDAVAPARTEGGEELSQRMVASLLNLMDGISRSDGILVIAGTNRPESIEPALRRPGRFDREIEIAVPSPTQRLDILQTILGEKKHSLSPVEIQQLALTTHGFVGADLAALCNQAALVRLRRHARFKEICNSIHLERSSVLHEDISNRLQKRSDCLVGMKDFFTTDSASSNVTEFPISMKIPSSSFVGREISKKMQDTNIGSIEALFVDGDYNLAISFEDFEKAKLKVRPSAMREVILEVPKVNWEDVGGQVEVKNQLKEAVLWSQEYKNALKRVGVGPPTGILMFGPPGCSKTMMARAVASEANLNFLAVKGPELFSKWVGESEKALRSLFAKARANAPSIIFFDEIDGLAVIRGKESDGVSVSDRVVSQLLIELNGLHQRVDVTVIAATNRPDMIDPALLRPGRFDRLLYVGPPNEIDREDIFRIHLRKFQCSSDVSIKELACLTEGYTGADISRICHEAATEAIREMVDASELDVSKVNVTMRHLKTAISQVEPSETQSYEELSNQFQRLVHTSNRGDTVKVGSSISPRGFQSGGPWSLIKTSVQLLFGLLMRASKSTPDE